jgi:hypothetical protein
MQCAFFLLFIHSALHCVGKVVVLLDWSRMCRKYENIVPQSESFHVEWTLKKHEVSIVISLPYCLRVYEGFVLGDKTIMPCSCC